MPPEWNSGASSFCPVCDSVWQFIILVLQCVDLRKLFFMPPEWNSGTSSFVLSVTLSVTLFKKTLTLAITFWTVRDTDFIFGMQTSLMKPFQMTPRSMTLWPWPYSKNSQFWTLLPPGAFVFHKHTRFIFLMLNFSWRALYILMRE